MSKPIKLILLAAAGVFVLLAGAAAIFAATFDPNDYKPAIIRLVQENKQRTLSIPGEIRLTFFPKIGADLGKVSLSERNSQAVFASVDSAKVSLALLPLLSKQLVVDRVKIDGLNATVRRFKDGSSNFDDLLSKEESSGSQVKLDIDGVSISNAHLLYDDQQARRKIELDKLGLETGKLADGAPSKIALSARVRGNNPDVDAQVAVKSGFTIDFDGKHYVFNDADAEIKGKLLQFTDLTLKVAGDADLKPADKRFVLDGVKFSVNAKHAGQPFDLAFEAPKLAITDAKVSGGKLRGEARLNQGGRAIHAVLKLPSFEGSPQAFTLPSMALDVSVKDKQLDAKAAVSGSVAGDIDKLLFTSPQLKLALSGKQGDTALDGSLSTPLSANFKTGLIELPNIAAAFTLPNPAGGAMQFNASGKAGADLGKSTLLAQLKGKLDESSFDAKLGMTRFSPAAYSFDIGIDRLDADRYRKKAAGAAQQAAGGAGQAAGRSAEKPAEKPIDLSAFKDLQANGALRIGTLKVANIRASNLRAQVHAGGGKLEINPLNAGLYGGSVAGSLSATAGAVPRFALRQNLAGVHVGPLLKDAIGKQPIEGRGNVSLDVTTQGGLAEQMKKNLNGTARLELRDGAVHGINVAQTIRTAKAGIGELRGNAPSQTGTGSAAEKTDFSEMTGSFRIASGVAHNEDLSVKSPLIRVGGAGDVNLGADRLDYLVKATVVTTLQGQGGPELQALKGLTIPVRLSGPFNAISYRVDFEGLAAGLAKQKLDEKKEELRKEAQKAIEEQKGKLGEQLFKGLFGK